MVIPEHIGIIMDGNGRWAKKRLLSKAMGHRAGAETLKKLSYYIEEIGVKYLTVYAFSTENWSRSDKEVTDLMNTLRRYLQDYIDDSEKNNMKVSAIGDVTRLDDDLQNKIKILTDMTKDKTGLSNIIALNYGGRDDIIRAVKNIITDVENNKVSKNEISEEIFSKYLDTYNMPDPDLIIRTSGELRLSNFFSWQSAYSELYFSEKLWPDFKNSDIDLAIEDFNKRKRNFGGR